jgi:hypothetical protein
MTQGAPTTGSVFERHRYATIVLLVLVSVLATDFGAKAAIDFAAGLRQGREPEPPRLQIRAEAFHHGLQPLMNGTNAWGPRVYPLVTNSLGFVDAAPRQVHLVTNLYRIVFLGDSFTEGRGVGYRDTFVGLVDAALKSRRVSVLNAAALSYSPIIYYRKMEYFLEEFGMHCDEVAVFIDISDIQDEVMYRFDEQHNVVWDAARRERELASNLAYGGEPVPAGPFQIFLADHTIALDKAFEAWRKLSGRDGAQTGRRRALWTVEPAIFREYGQEGMRNAKEHMDALAALLARHGIRLTVAVYPWPDQIVRRDLASMQVALWREWAQARGADFIDLFPRFLAGSAPEQVLARDFIPGDVHWNEAGHRVVADAVIEHYRDRELTPRPIAAGE